MSLLDIIGNVTGNMEQDKETEKKNVAHHVFSGSTTMIGACITIITLFKTSNMAKTTYADEILGVDTFIFIISSLLSYASLRKEGNYKLEWWADIIFFIGMLLMLIVGFIIVFTDM